MKANYQKSLKNLTKYFVNNKEFFIGIAGALGKGAGTIGLLYLASKLDLPVTVSPNGEISTKSNSFKFNSKDPLSDLNITIPNVIFSRNSTDSAIATFAELAKSADWDSTRIEYIKKIFSIAKDCTDENTRMLAINSINQITNGMDFEYRKREATNYIMNLVKQ